METVLVTELEFRKAEEVFRNAKDVRCEPAPVDEAALTEAVVSRGARAVIVGVAPYRGALYEALGKKNGAIIARFGVGHDSVNKPLARQHGIVVTNTPGVLDVSVAEHALWLMGCLARKVSRLEARLRAGEFIGEVGMELRGKTLGVLGFGAIGRRVAAIAHFGFGMKVIACDQIPPDKMAEVVAANGVERYTTDAEELLRQSDFVSIHLPVVPATQRFINATRLAWLKPSAMLVNTARGAVLDEEALYDALAAGRLAGAALDVFEREPYIPAHPDKDLRKLENVVLTPHVGSNTREANRRMAESALENVRCFLAGKLDRLARVDQP
ncbi:MAG: NAD(P)-dependent oxidoreductase [Verrucomicrobiia bacterium]